ncbi:folylpolyglutamate synthase [Spiroplasma corruscae]|uniref:Folylpolyglutamate synthase n=1 Tax=Spiroplasma corruscae TaxID=216934 RepID=A0A222ENG7_9MOLU|nr:Mur ligase family protein [Spiroplasma corruscae]ASP27833.1 folylpolyglutamate synthase [Spiroplasma corruscae]
MIRVDESFIETKILFRKKYNLKKLLEDVGNPQNNIKVINVVGTNGKGSTSKFIYDGLRTKYQNVGLFISPAFIYQNERVQANGQYIDDESLKKIYEDNKKTFLEYELTFFEIWTFIAIVYFNAKGVEYAVIEAGIGGKLDCTNLFNNQVAVCLTSISFDHTELLGNTIEEIIDHKINITKLNNPVFISNDNIKYKKIINKYTSLNIVYTKKAKSNISYQKANVGLAKKVLDYLGIKVSTFIPPIGRFTILREKPLLLIDGCHNIDGLMKFTKDAKKYKNFKLVYASSKDKDYLTSLNFLRKKFKNIYITEFNHQKSWIVPNELKGKYTFIDNWQSFLDKNIYNNIVVCGSLYFIPQVLEWYRSNK